jgi:FkbM family methyltransferase
MVIKNKKKLIFITTVDEFYHFYLNLVYKDGLFLVEASKVSTKIESYPDNQIIVFVTNLSNPDEGIANRKNVILIRVSSTVSEFQQTETGLLINNYSQLNPLIGGQADEILTLWSDNFESQKISAKKLRIDFFEKIRFSQGVYIFGAGTIGKQVLYECTKKNIPVKGFIDNGSLLQGNKINGLIVHSLEQINPDKEVVVVASGNYSDSITNQLSSMHYQNYFNLSEFFFSIESDLQPEISFIQDLENNRYKWLKLALELQDKTSHRVLNALIKHRLSLDTNFLSEIKEIQYQQWFDKELIQRNPCAVFVDAGAYDGDTAEAFHQFNGNCKKIYAFEIDEENALKAKIRLKNITEAKVYPLGVSDTKKKVKFDKTGITNAHLNQNNAEGVEITVVSIDDQIKDSITYLKMDVEGSEEDAIKGAARQITLNSPYLGIAVYHKAGDVWKIFEQIKKINPNYRFYLRHYTDVAYETVLYAIPKC